MFAEVTAVNQGFGFCTYDISLSPGNNVQGVQASELVLVADYKPEEPKKTIKHGWTKWPM